MCGIWGAVGSAGQQMAETAAQAMRHRGPDDYGTYVQLDPIPVALVNTRLAIIDLSETGHQPMVTPDGRYWIVYNGETYNYEPIRRMLEEQGHSFRSTSDTEVILHAYQEWGTGCLDHLRGMFAFAIWDTQEQKLFAARDRLGIKPLYYHRHDEGKKYLVFGSELKVLLKSGLVKPRLNYAALHHYLSFYSVPAPYSIIDGVEMLPPGHYLTYQNGRLTVKQYWSLPAIEPLKMSEADIVVRLRELLEESIRLRMIADVQVGAFLSGGVDSGAIVALMSRASGERLRTFSIGFGDEGSPIDERSAARTLADYYHTDHTEVIVNGQMMRDQIDRIILAMDQPGGDGLNTYFVSQATAEHVKVALSGLGGDELFAGYPQFRFFQQVAQIEKFWKMIPGPLQERIRLAGKRSDQIHKGLLWLDGDLLDRYQRVRVLFNEERKLELYTPATINWLIAPESSLKYLSRFVHPAESDPVIQIMRLELFNYMTHTLLRDSDAMSMAHSLELRVPLIDHKLVEFAARIPPGMKLKGKHNKWIFTRALEGLMPAEVFRRPKRGFEMPVASWLRHEMRDVLDDVFSQQAVTARGLFKYEETNRLYQDFLTGESNQPYMFVWSLAALELWMRRFIDQPLP